MFRPVVLLLSMFIISAWSAESLSVTATAETAGPVAFRWRRSCAEPPHVA